MKNFSTPSSFRKARDSMSSAHTEKDQAQFLGDSFEALFSQRVDMALDKYREEIEIISGPTGQMASRGFPISSKVEWEVLTAQANLTRRMEGPHFENSSALYQVYKEELRNLNDREHFQMDKFVFVRAKKDSQIREISISDQHYTFTYQLPMVLIGEATVGNTSSRLFDKLCRSIVSSSFAKHGFSDFFRSGGAGIEQPEDLHTYIVLSTAGYWHDGFTALSNIDRKIFSDNESLSSLLGWSHPIVSPLPHKADTKVSRNNQKLGQFQSAFVEMSQSLPVSYYHLRFKTESKEDGFSSAIFLAEVDKIVERKVLEHSINMESRLEKRIIDLDVKISESLKRQKTEWTSDIDKLRQEMSDEFGKHRHEMNKKFVTLKNQIKKELEKHKEETKEEYNHLKGQLARLQDTLDQILANQKKASITPSKSSSGTIQNSNGRSTKKLKSQ
jgi:hypothetical protein